MTPEHAQEWVTFVKNNWEFFFLAAVSIIVFRQIWKRGL
jgi:hypothetical protein